MTKTELMLALADVPDDAEIMIPDTEYGGASGTDSVVSADDYYDWPYARPDNAYLVLTYLEVS